MLTEANLLEWKKIEWNNINRSEALLISIHHTHTHSLRRMSERERTIVGDHIFCLWVLLLPFVLILSLRKLWAFLLYGFPEENYLCLLSLVIIDVHVILSDKILRSYCLNYKNLTMFCKVNLINVDINSAWKYTKMCTKFSKTYEKKIL